MSIPDPYRLHASVLYQLTLTARLQERRLDEGLKALGLTRISWCVLLAVENEGRQQPSDIAEFIGIDRTAMSRTLRQMEASDLIARHPGAAPDKRRTTVQLTDAGRALLYRATPVAVDNAQHFLTKLSADDVSRLRDLLADLRRDEPRNLVTF